MITQPLNQWCIDTQKEIEALKRKIVRVEATNYLLIVMEAGTLAAIIALIVH